MNLILITGITTPHLALTESRTILAFVRYMLLHAIRFATKLHSSSFVTKLSALLFPALSAKALGCWFLKTPFGRWLGTVIAVLLVRQFLYLSSQLGDLLRQ